MKVLDVVWTPEKANASQEEKLKMIDEEVERYSTWLANLPDSRASGALNNPERALIKTYLVQKMNGKLDEVGNGTSEG